MRQNETRRRPTGRNSPNEPEAGVALRRCEHTRWKSWHTCLSSADRGEARTHVPPASSRLEYLQPPGEGPCLSVRALPSARRANPRLSSRPIRASADDVAKVRRVLRADAPARSRRRDDRPGRNDENARAHVSSLTLAIAPIAPPSSTSSPRRLLRDVQAHRPPPRVFPRTAKVATGGPPVGASRRRDARGDLHAGLRFEDRQNRVVPRLRPRALRHVPKRQSAVFPRVGRRVAVRGGRGPRRDRVREVVAVRHARAVRHRVQTTSHRLVAHRRDVRVRSRTQIRGRPRVGFLPRRQVPGVRPARALRRLDPRRRRRLDVASAFAVATETSRTRGGPRTTSIAVHDAPHAYALILYAPDERVLRASNPTSAGRRRRAARANAAGRRRRAVSAGLGGSFLAAGGRDRRCRVLNHVSWRAFADLAHADRVVAATVAVYEEAEEGCSSVRWRWKSADPRTTPASGGTTRWTATTARTPLG